MAGAIKKPWMETALTAKISSPCFHVPEAEKAEQGSMYDEPKLFISLSRSSAQAKIQLCKLSRVQLYTPAENKSLVAQEPNR